MGAAALLSASDAEAGEATGFGPNTDFPDATLVIPFVGSGGRTTFLSTGNVGAGPVDAEWTFFDLSGEIIATVTRNVLGEAGTDLVDITAVDDRPSTGQPVIDLTGFDGFAVVVGDGTDRLFGSFTVADVQTNSAFGGVATGLGFVGQLEPDATLLGSTFNPSLLEDNLLMIIGLDQTGLVPISLTARNPPEPGEVVFDLTVTLHVNDGDGILAQTTVPVSGSAWYGDLQSLFPGVNLNTGASIAAFSESGVRLMGYYGQALGPFGAGQNLRTQ